MKVFKFGGASIRDAAAIKHVANIVSSFGRPLVVVVSAMGKTTNALEQVVEAACNGNDAGTRLQEILDSHEAVLAELDPKLLTMYRPATEQDVQRSQRYLERAYNLPFDLVYDQVVSLGELLSTTLVSLYLNNRGIGNTWVDIRDYIRTDNTYRDGRVDWTFTEGKVAEKLAPMLADGGLVVTQGFLGSTNEGQTTTLGREGSDYTASILAYCLGAECVMVWKDVPGVLNADPRYFERATKIDHLSYHDAIEMTYYGAKVIHPKTIQPLQRKKIPLHVRSFIKPEGSGTVISDLTEPGFVPPMIVVKPNQVMYTLSTPDFSFIAEDHLSYIYEQFARSRVKMNLVQHSAISLRVCFDQDERKQGPLYDALEARFEVKEDKPLKLLTLRYYNEDLLAQMKKGSQVLLEERSRNTAQLLLWEKEDGDGLKE